MLYLILKYNTATDEKVLHIYHEITFSHNTEILLHVTVFNASKDYLVFRHRSKYIYIFLNITVVLIPRGLMVPRKSKRSYTVFRDDFNSFNRGSYHVDVTAWGGGVCYF